MTDLEDLKSQTLTKNLNKLKNIIGGKKLIEKVNSITDSEQFEDIKAEIEVGVYLIRKGYTVKYEPNLQGIDKPPEYQIVADNDEFYVEVKRVREHAAIRRRNKVISDLKSRIEKLPFPYMISFSPNYSEVKDTSYNKKIVSSINTFLKNISPEDFGKPIDIHIDSKNLGHFRVYKSTGQFCKLSVDSFSYGGIEDVIREQLKNANSKTVPVDKPFIIVIKLPWHANDVESEYGTFGNEQIRLYVPNERTRPIIYETIRDNRIFGHPKHYKKISAVIYYKGEMTPENIISYYINSSANNKVDEFWIRKFFYN